LSCLFSEFYFCLEAADFLGNPAANKKNQILDLHLGYLCIHIMSTTNIITLS
jgi:hypothetical protein